jgi:hypothetical protein
MANTMFETQDGSNQNTSFLNGKNHTPLKPRQIKLSAKLNERRQLPLKKRTQSFINWA